MTATKKQRSKEAKKPSPAIEAPKRYKGTCAWLCGGEGFEGEVTRAFDRGHEFVMDAVTDSGLQYTVKLHRKATPNGDLLGTVGGEGRGECSARVFLRGENLALVGIWKEDGDVYRWWVHLEKEPED